MDDLTLLNYRLHHNISKMLLEKYNILSVIDVLNSSHIEYVDLHEKLIPLPMLRLQQLFSPVLIAQCCVDPQLPVRAYYLLIMEYID